VVGCATGEAVAGDVFAASATCNIDFIVSGQIEREGLGIGGRNGIAKRARRVG